MDYLSLIQSPIKSELNDFIELFGEALSHTDGLLSDVLNRFKQHGGKRMRPMLVLLIAKNFGKVTSATLHGAVSLELLHTASLAHDDVIDESKERRGISSINAIYDNRISILVGDFILATSLKYAALTHSEPIVTALAELGRTLSTGEILQLSSEQAKELSEDLYRDIIQKKTGSLFELCGALGALSVGAGEKEVEASREFGRNLGIIFQIRDDIFDYYDSSEVGKPTGNDMIEGKLTLPVIYALRTTQNQEMKALAEKVSSGDISADEIATLVAFTKENGGIEYAQKVMHDYWERQHNFIDTHVKDEEIGKALSAYLDYIIKRKK